MKYKAVHIGLIAISAIALVAAYRHWQPPAVVVLMLAAALLVPSRVQGWYWRDFFRGRRLLAAGRAQEAALHFERFLAQIRAQPSLRRLIWLNGAMYTRDVEAMTQNNLGAALLQVGDLKAARSALDTAVRLDPLYPMPYFNLALLAQAEGAPAAAAGLLERSRALGFDRATCDQLLGAAGRLLAVLEGRGSSLPSPGRCRHCGYDLTGASSARCSECGEVIAQRTPPEAP
jgi:tetratricopeptide (TPR) repeat protein